MRTDRERTDASREPNLGAALVAGVALFAAAAIPLTALYLAITASKLLARNNAAYLFSFID